MTDDARSNDYGRDWLAADADAVAAADHALHDALVARTARHDAWANRAAKVKERKQHFAAFDAIVDQIGGLAGELGAWSLDDTADVFSEQRRVLQEIVRRSLESRAASQEGRKADANAAVQLEQVIDSLKQLKSKLDSDILQKRKNVEDRNKVWRAYNKKCPPDQPGDRDDDPPEVDR